MIAAGNTWLDLEMLLQAVRSAPEAPQGRRHDLGGITPICKVMALAEAYGMDGGDPVLGLHADPGGQSAVMLAYANCDYFEQPVPYPAFELGAKTVIRTDAQGDMSMRRQPGLGIDLDWTAIESAAIMKYEIR